MKSTYEIRPAQNLFVKTHRGKITVDNEIELLEAVINDPRYRTGMNAICDFSNATVAWSMSELDEVRAYLARIADRIGDCSWALIFPAGTDKSTARIFIALNDAFQERISVQLFERVEDGLAWIHEQRPPQR